MSLKKIIKNEAGIPTGTYETVAGGTLWADSPIGTILAYGGSTAPDGWHICDGTALNRSAYAGLFAAIGTTFGAGNGSTTFNIPDAREAALVGAGQRENGVEDHDTYTIGQFKDDQLQNHIHGSISPGMGSGSTRIVTSGTEGEPLSTWNSNTETPVSGRRGTTTHGKRLGVNYIIKTKQVSVPADIATAVTQQVSEQMQTITEVIPTGTSSSNKLVNNTDANTIIEQALEPTLYTDHAAGSRVTWRNGKPTISISGKVVQITGIIDEITDTTSQFIVALSNVPKPLTAVEAGMPPVAITGTALGLYLNTNGELVAYDRINAMYRVNIAYIRQ